MYICIWAMDHQDACLDGTVCGTFESISALWAHLLEAKEKFTYIEMRNIDGEILRRWGLKENNVEYKL